MSSRFNLARWERCTLWPARLGKKTDLGGKYLARLPKARKEFDLCLTAALRSVHTLLFRHPSTHPIRGTSAALSSSRRRNALRAPSLCDVTSRESVSMGAGFNAAATNTDISDVLGTTVSSHLGGRSQPQSVRRRSCVVPRSGRVTSRVPSELRA